MTGLEGLELGAVGEAQGGERRITDVEGELNGGAAGKTVIGLEGDGGGAAVAGVGGEAEGVAVGFELGVPVGAVNHPPKQAVAFGVGGEVAEVLNEVKIGMGEGRGVGLGGGLRGAVGVKPLVGEEDLAVGGVGLAVAVEVGLGVAGACRGAQAGFELGAVGAVNLAVLVEVAGDLEVDLGRPLAGELEGLETTLGEAQEQGALVAQGAVVGVELVVITEQGAAGQRERGGGAGIGGDLNLYDQAGGGGLGGADEFAVTQEEAKGDGLVAEAALPGVGAGVGGPVGGGAEVGGQGGAEALALGVVAVDEAQRRRGRERVVSRQGSLFLLNALGCDVELHLFILHRNAWEGLI